MRRELRALVVVAGALMAFVRPAAGQQAFSGPDSAAAEVRAVLRAYYTNYKNRNWDALAAYVLSPKLLERRGAPGDQQMVNRDRTRGRASASSAAAPKTCPSSSSPMVADAVIQIDGDWAEVSVPRCQDSFAGVDEFRLLYFEQRWRFIYTDMFDTPPASATARR
jgi:hypothetical protein